MVICARKLFIFAQVEVRVGVEHHELFQNVVAEACESNHWDKDRNVLINSLEASGIQNKGWQNNNNDKWIEFQSILFCFV